MRFSSVHLRPNAYSQHSQASKMELFEKIVNGFLMLTILAKR